MRQDDVDERAPLLRIGSSDLSSTDTSSSSGSFVECRSMSDAAPIAKFLRNNVIAILYLYLMVLEFGNYLQAAPRAAIYEGIICHRQERPKASELASSIHDTGHAQNHCKGHAVQDELAFVRGMQEMFDCLPGLFLAMPYGHLANYYGRKLILLLALLGMCLQYTWVLAMTWFSTAFPLRLVWISSLFQVIGGGQAVSRSLAFVIVSDVTAETHRSTVFFRVESVTLIARAAASTLSSLLMAHDLWLPMFLGLALIYLGSCLALLLPSTQHVATWPVDEAGEPGPNEATRADSEAEEASSLLHPAHKKNQEPMVKAIWHAVSQDKRVMLLMLLAVLGQLSSRTTGLLLQYVAKRFEWTFARANMILVLRMVVTVVALLALVPLLTPILPRLPRSIRPASNDLFLARMSTLLLAAGLVFMALADEPPLMILGVTIFSCGFGAFSALRSVLTTIVLSSQSDGLESGAARSDTSNVANHISIIYAAMSLGQTIAKSLAGPIYAGLFHVGQKLGGIEQGIPFAFAAALALAVHVALWYPYIASN